MFHLLRERESVRFIFFTLTVKRYTRVCVCALLIPSVARWRHHTHTVSLCLLERKLTIRRMMEYGLTMQIRAL